MKILEWMPVRNMAVIALLVPCCASCALKQHHSRWIVSDAAAGSARQRQVVKVLDIEASRVGLVRMKHTKPMVLAAYKDMAAPHYGPKFAQLKAKSSGREIVIDLRTGKNPKISGRVPFAEVEKSIGTALAGAAGSGVKKVDR